MRATSPSEPADRSSEAPDRPAIPLPAMPGRPFKGTAEKLPSKPSHGHDGRSTFQARPHMGEATKGGVNFTPWHIIFGGPNYSPQFALRSYCLYSLLSSTFFGIAFRFSASLFASAIAFRSRPLRRTLLLTLFLRFYNNDILFSSQCAAKHFFHHESQRSRCMALSTIPHGGFFFFCLFLFFPFFREVSSSLF